MNNRRKLVVALGAGPLAWACAALSQSKKPPVVIGWISLGRRSVSSGTLAALKEGLAGLGWKDGTHYVLEERWAEGRVDRLPGLVEELVATKPAIIVAGPVQATIAAAKFAPQIPIVQATGSSPVDVGLAKSLARPGGMVTGVTNLSAELSAKFLALLLEAAPKLKRVGFVVDSTSLSHGAYLATARRAAESYRVEAHFAEIAKAEEIESAIARLAKQGVQGLVVLPSLGLLSINRQSILNPASLHRWPVIAYGGAWVRAGALLSYTADITVLYRRAAYYVDRIMKGTKPADLPIEQPMTFELVVNLKIAKALGLTMPPEIMVQATRVIQ